MHRQHAIWTGWLVALVGLAALALWNPFRTLARGGADGRGATAAGAAEGDLDVHATVPEFDLVSQTGEPVHLADLRGQVWVADFIFTHCASTCPMMTAQMQRFSSALGDEPRVRLVSFSVDPQRDTPARLAEYARGLGATPDRWLFLTGDAPQIRRLARDGFHLPVEDPAPEDVARGAEAVLHSTRFVLVDAQGRIRGYYDGTEERAVQRLGSDVRQLLRAP